MFDFLKRGSPAELAERERNMLAQILGVSADDLRGPGNPPARLNGTDAHPVFPLVESGASDIEELRDRCRIYERALRKIVAEEPNGTAAEIAKAALRLFR